MPATCGPLWRPSYLELWAQLAYPRVGTPLPWLLCMTAGHFARMSCVSVATKNQVGVGVPGVTSERILVAVRNPLLPVKMGAPRPGTIAPLPLPPPSPLSTCGPPFLTGPSGFLSPASQDGPEIQGCSGSWPNPAQCHAGAWIAGFAEQPHVFGSRDFLAAKQHPLALYSGTAF